MSLLIKNIRVDLKFKSLAVLTWLVVVQTQTIPSTQSGTTPSEQSSHHRPALYFQIQMIQQVNASYIILRWFVRIIDLYILILNS